MPLHIIVCIKSVVREASGGAALRTPENSELNPFDRPALEAALRVREELGGSVTALSMGPRTAAEALGEALAMGVDQAILISDRALAGSDTLVTAAVLARGIEKLAPFDLVFFGTRTADSDTGQVGPQTALLLGLPFLSKVKEMSRGEDGWKVMRTMDDWEEDWEVQGPWAATIHGAAFEARPVGLAAISRVYDGSAVQEWSLRELGISPDAVGLSGSPTRVASMEKIKRARTCLMLEGEPREQVKSLLQRLDDAGVIG